MTPQEVAASLLDDAIYFEQQGRIAADAGDIVAAAFMFRQRDAAMADALLAERGEL